MTDPFAAIKKRHSDIPQDSLPIVLPDATGASEPMRTKGVVSVRHAQCPECHKDKPTGVVRLHDGTEVFRDHNKVLTTGRRIRCNGSGKEAPQ